MSEPCCDLAGRRGRHDPDCEIGKVEREELADAAPDLVRDAYADGITDSLAVVREEYAKATGGFIAWKAVIRRLERGLKKARR